MPDLYKQAFDSQGRAYFYSLATRASVWELPSNAVLVPPDPPPSSLKSQTSSSPSIPTQNQGMVSGMSQKVGTSVNNVRFVDGPNVYLGQEANDGVALGKGRTCSSGSNSDRGQVGGMPPLANVQSAASNLPPRSKSIFSGNSNGAAPQTVATSESKKKSVAIAQQSDNRSVTSTGSTLSPRAKSAFGLDRSVTVNPNCMSLPSPPKGSPILPDRSNQSLVSVPSPPVRSMFVVDKNSMFNPSTTPSQAPSGTTSLKSIKPDLNSSFQSRSNLIRADSDLDLNSTNGSSNTKSRSTAGNHGHSRHVSYSQATSPVDHSYRQDFGLGEPFKRTRVLSGDFTKAISESIWVECKEVKSGRSLWYHSANHSIVFDRHPNTIGHQPKASISIQSINAANLQPVSASSMQSSSGNRTFADNLPTPVSFDRKIAPGWERNDDGSWYNAQTFDSRDVDDPPYLDIIGAKVQQDEVIKYTETPETAAKKLSALEYAKWDFSNPRCEVYRSRVARLDHSEFLPSVEYLVCPQYFSTLPLPPLCVSITILIQIPDEFVNPKILVKSVKNVSRASDRASDIIDYVLARCKEGLPMDKFVLKVLGKHEYMYGDAKVFDFEFIRYCLRHNIDANVVLTYKPLKDVPNCPVFWLAPSQYDQHYHEMDTYEEFMDQITYLDAGTEKPEDPAAFFDWEFLPWMELNQTYHFKVHEIINITALPRWNANLSEIIVSTTMFHGTLEIKGTQLRTKSSKIIEDPRFNQKLSLPNLMINTLPRETRICFLVYGVNFERQPLLLGFVNQNLIDDRGCLISGTKALKLWPMIDSKEKYNRKDDLLRYLPDSPSWENSSVEPCATLYISYDQYALPVIAPLLPPPVQIDEMVVGAVMQPNLIAAFVREQVDALAATDPLYDFSEDEKNLFWAHRHSFVHNSAILAKFLNCVNWSDHQRQAEAHRLINLWAPLSPYEAIQLLDVRYPDTFVRQHAVQSLWNISDSELASLLLQLVQVLKYEPYHDSMLTRFLIERCLRNPYQVGHFFFWHLQAEVHNLEFMERYGLIKEEYLKHAAQHTVELHVQYSYNLRLQEIADTIARNKNVEGMATAANQQLLEKMLLTLNKDLPIRFQVMLHPTWVARRLIPEKCKFMSSKKVPLWLVFENADPGGGNICVIFKSGDDLRQDILTLQLIRMMDRIWLLEQIDLKLKPYSVIATGVNKDGEGVGMIEVVLKSSTISDVQMDMGGSAAGAFVRTTLNDYIKKYNDPNGPRYLEAVVNFKRSCAGYCVATFILGIGDRHNGNIMLTQSGHLFHIDFGHFLGNFKKKLGFKRERSPFVFTPEMAYVIAGDNTQSSKTYNEFLELCCKAYNVLRKNSTLFINLFILMLTAGMPELSTFEDIYYLRDMLYLKLDEIKAAELYKKEIQDSLNETWRLIDNFFHNWLHGSKK